jgi:hypothetical protein
VVECSPPYLPFPLFSSMNYFGVATFVKWVLEVLPRVYVKSSNQIEIFVGFLDLSELVAVFLNITNWDLFGFRVIS